MRNSWSKFYGYYQRRAASLVFKKPFSVNLQQPLISFTFDDFPRSALLTGGAILKRFGLAGTYYASLGLAGKETPSGQLFVSGDLTTLLEQGHELGCHTFAHCDSWDTATAEFEKSLLENRAALRALLPGAEFKSFSYPISLPRPRTKAKVAERFLCCRAGGQALNVGTIDLNQLSAYFLEKTRGDMQPIKDLIDRNRQVRGWLIFATHDISDQPTPFGCTPEFFEHIVRYAVSSGARIVPVVQALELLGVPGCQQRATPRLLASIPAGDVRQSSPAKPRVSILIPAFNSQEWIADTIHSALAQTCENKEIIVVDDGSTDRTLAIARQFESDGVCVVTQRNQGAAVARNHAFSLSRGDYIQWLDADDLLAPDKIARQMEVFCEAANKRTVVCSAFGKFQYRWYRAQFVPTELWRDLSPADWLLCKMGDNLYMQTATWLVSRELCEAAGQWDVGMLSDDDGEYFCRILLNSDGVRFVPDAKVYYRAFGYDSLAYVGASSRKLEALWRSMQLHISYLRSLEDSPRTRAACLAYLQRNLLNFYPDKSEIVEQAKRIANDLGGQLRTPHLSWKYAWIKTAFGWVSAKRTSRLLRKTRWSCTKMWDRTLFHIENRQTSGKIWDAEE